MDGRLSKKLEDLKKSIGQYRCLAVAFSGGVDSSLLLKTAHDVLGDDAVALTASSVSMPSREMRETVRFCKDEDIRHFVVETHEFDIEGFKSNPANRCYLCKREILSCLRAKAEELGFDTIAEGSNIDDDGDFRPGFQAVREAGVISPLRDAGLSKADVRELARKLGLSVWNKPALACLNTRFAYGEALLPERLAMVDQAENFLNDKGFAQVRVRVQGDTARIEVPHADIGRLMEENMRSEVARRLREIGFAYISADLEGYRTGSMNETM